MIINFFLRYLYYAAINKNAIILNVHICFLWLNDMVCKNQQVSGNFRYTYLTYKYDVTWMPNLIQGQISYNMKNYFNSKTCVFHTCCNNCILTNVFWMLKLTRVSRHEKCFMCKAEAILHFRHMRSYQYSSQQKLQ